MGAPGISCYTPLVASCSTGGLVGIGFCVPDLLNVSVAGSCSLPSLFLSLSCLSSLFLFLPYMTCVLFSVHTKF